MISTTTLPMSTRVITITHYNLCRHCYTATPSIPMNNIITSAITKTTCL